jgi:hypothetical protein
MVVNPRHTPRPASTGMVARHGPESWPGMLRNWWPAWTGIRNLGLGCPELGYVSLAELSTVRGKLGLPVERDRHFEANKSIAAYTEEARTRGYIAT